MTAPGTRHRRPVRWLAAIALGVCLAASGHATSEHAPVGDAAANGHAAAEHVDPFSSILVELAVLISAALLGRWGAERIRQPAVLGELLIGVAIGNVGYWVGQPFFVMMMLGNAPPLFAEAWASGVALGDPAQQIFSPELLAPGGPAHGMLDILSGPAGSRLLFLYFAVWLFSNLGVILLLMMVGLESNVDEMLRVGGRALRVATTGVVAPFALGILASRWLAPGGAFAQHLFLGAALSATSVGITARVFRDLGRLHTAEAKVILGAAVIDDVLGLIVLAICSGVVVTGAIAFSQVLRITLASVMFFGVILAFGDRFVRRAIGVLAHVDRRNAKLLFPLAFTFVLAWLANQIGLATIVGAFAAGLVLDERQFGEPFEGDQRTVQSVVGPLEAVFAPVFFILMGLQVNLAAFARPRTLALAAALIVCAVAGKLVAGAVAGRRIDRLSIGIGMVPRGEVGLIFAGIGKALNVLDNALFSAVVMMVIVTTLMTPIALRWSLFRHGRG
jgi:Kef-type K+ transport system membrane component KefB